MAIKVYLNENYLIVENGNVYGEGLAKDVRVNRLYVDIPEDGIQKYSFTNVNNISEQFAFRDAPDGDVLILDENGDPYANEAAFETFYLANTGKSSGGATPTDSAWQNVMATGNTSSIEAKLTFEAGLYMYQEESNDYSTLLAYNILRAVRAGVAYSVDVLALIPFNGVNAPVLNYDRILNWHTYNDDSVSKTLREISDWIGNEIVITNASTIQTLTVSTSSGLSQIFDNGVLGSDLIIAAGQTVSFFNNGQIIITR